MLEIIKNIINEWDPVGLIAMHAPDNEYLAEIHDIYEYFYENSNITVDKLTQKIYDVFCKSFGREVFCDSVEECRKIAIKLLHGI